MTFVVVHTLYSNVRMFSRLLCRNFHFISTKQNFLLSSIYIYLSSIYLYISIHKHIGKHALTEYFIYLFLNIQDIDLEKVELLL